MKRILFLLLVSIAVNASAQYKNSKGEWLVKRIERKLIKSDEYEPNHEFTVDFKYGSTSSDYTVTFTYPEKITYISDEMIQEVINNNDINEKEARDNFYYIKKTNPYFKKHGSDWVFDNPNSTSTYHITKDSIIYKYSNEDIKKTKNISLNKNGFVDRIEETSEIVYYGEIVENQKEKNTYEYKRDNNNQLISTKKYEEYSYKLYYEKKWNNEKYIETNDYNWDNNGNITNIHSINFIKDKHDTKCDKSYIELENNLNIDLNQLVYDFSRYMECISEEAVILPIGIKTTNLMFKLGGYGVKANPHNIEFDKLGRIISFNRGGYKFKITYL